MLGKLMKYEWRGLSKPLLILLAVLASTTLLSSFLILTINPSYDDVSNGLSIVLTFASLLLYYFGIIASSVGTSLIIAVRFYKTCYTDQGYLTHTLPVSPKQLVAAKTIMACVCQLLMFVCIIVSIVTVVGVFFAHMINISDSSFSFTWDIMEQNFQNHFGIGTFHYFVFLALYCLICSITGTCMILGCVSLGQLFTKHRVLGAIIAYFAVSMILQIITFMGMIPMYIRLFTIAEKGRTITPIEVMQPLFLIILAASIIIAIVMHFVNIHMMTKKLNLE